MKSLPTPIFMYHTVGKANPAWLWSFLTLDFVKFDQQMSVLKRLDCHSITLEELYDHMENGTSIPKNSFVLTFDDGYLDHWVAVAPILKKYGFRGTVYVNPEFVDPTDQYRPSLEDVWNNNASINDLKWDGFLSWNEMRKMESDGVLDIQSHAMSHTWYYESPDLVDFQHPNDPYIWTYWNKYPEKKHSYMTDATESLKEYGAPIYKHGKSLAIRRYFPNKNIHEEMVAFVEENDSEQYFMKNGWKNKLKSLHANLLLEYGEGHYETDIEYKERIDYELARSKELLELNLNKQINYFCWPGGGYNDYSMKRALELYKSLTLSSRDQQDKRNVFGDDPKTIKRIGLPYVAYGSGENDIDYLGGMYLYFQLKSFQGGRLNNFMRKTVKAIGLAKAKVSHRMLRNI